MTIAQLAHPEWFNAVVWSLALMTCAVGLSAWRKHRQRRLLMGVGTVAVARRWTSDIALLVALSAIGIALLGPRIGERLVAMNATGIDVVVLVDVSRSMDARDNPPSRLDRAKRALDEIFARLEPNDRVALAAFAGRGVLLAPLTPDLAALTELAAALDTDLIHPASSNLDAGIRAAVTGFEAGSERPRVVAVFSDGEDPSNREPVGISAALAAETRVVTLAFGSEAGSAIPASDVPMRDRTGRVVISRRRTDRLARLAKETHGVSFVADAWGSFDFDAAAREVRREASALAGERVERRLAAVRIAPFAALAFILLIAEGLPRVRLSPRRRGVLAGMLAASLLVGAAPSDTGGSSNPDAVGDDRTPPPEAFEARLRGHPRDARTLYALGFSRLAYGRSKAAAAAFSAAAVYAQEPRLAAMSHYALGVSELERGKLELARDAFFDALAFDPGDDRARFNLEWTMLALHEVPPPEQEQPPVPKRHPDAAPEDERPEADSDETDPELPAETAEAEAQRPAALSDAQRQRALARVRDELGPSVRAAAREGSDETRKTGPVW